MNKKQLPNKTKRSNSLDAFHFNAKHHQYDELHKLQHEFIYNSHHMRPGSHGLAKDLSHTKSKNDRLLGYVQ